ncbi:GPO family capsid scaffolding protein, partial [Xanthomonas arboricola pv. corylina]
MSAKAKKFRSNWFRVAVEGATTDGRTIQRSWIDDMAATYNRETYNARIWIEHMRSLLPDSPFRAYGDVTAVKAEEVEIDGAKRLALFAQIEPTADLITINKSKQKLYTSIEVQEKFANTGKAYLVGLAVTDSPASLGTSMLSFASQNPHANPLADRKQSPGNLFTVAEE